MLAGDAPAAFLVDALVLDDGVVGPRDVVSASIGHGNPDTTLLVDTGSPLQQD